jgi:hypothetical protein
MPPPAATNNAAAASEMPPMSPPDSGNRFLCMLTPRYLPLQGSLKFSRSACDSYTRSAIT